MNYVLDYKKHKVIRVFWATLLLVCFCTCLYQSFDRISYYLKEPVAVDVSIVEASFNYLPSATICATETEGMIDYKKKCSVKDDPSELLQVSMYKFLKCNETIDFEKLWKALDSKKVVSVFQVKDKEEVELPTKTKDIYREPGTCVEHVFKTENDNILLHKMTEIVVKVRCPQEKCYEVMAATIQSPNIRTDPRAGIIVWSGMIARVSFFTNEFQFKNRKRSPCVDDASYNACHETCLVRKFWESSNCRLPNFPKKMNAPPCTGNNLTAILTKSILLVLKTDAAIACKCTRRCQNIQYEVSFNVDGVDYEELLIHLVTAKMFVTQFKERFAYDILTLLSEIGGNLGLNVGLSLLSAVQLSYMLVKGLVQAKWFKPSDAIYNRVKRLFADKCESFENTVIDTGGITQKLKNLIWILCAIASCYFIYVRISYYFSDPVRVLVSAKETDIVVFPILTVCGDSKDVSNTKNKVGNKNKVDCSKLNMELLDIMEKMKNNITKLWLSSSIANTFVSEKILSKETGVAQTTPEVKASESFVLLPDGNCTVFTIGKQFYLGRPANFRRISMDAEVSLRSCKNKNRKVYVSNVGEPVDLTNYMLHPLGTLFALGFRIEEIIRLNTTSRPCVSSDDYLSCAKHCLSRLFRMNINCSLPYMSESKKPPCKTMKDAKEANKIYQTLTMTTDPVQDCHCIQRCNVIIYKSSGVVVTLKKLDFTVFMTFFDSNINMQYTEVRAYSSISCICDIGGNLGLTLGFSLLSVFDGIQRIASGLYVRTRIGRKY